MQQNKRKVSCIHYLWLLDLLSTRDFDSRVFSFSELCFSQTTQLLLIAIHNQAAIVTGVKRRGWGKKVKYLHRFSRLDIILEKKKYISLNKHQISTKTFLLYPCETVSLSSNVNLAQHMTERKPCHIMAVCK